MANQAIGNFLRDLSASMTEGRSAPSALVWDQKLFPFGVAPGGNKAALHDCATCGRPPTRTPRNDLPLAHLFRDELSAQEYRISAMCQECQNDVFDNDAEDVGEEAWSDELAKSEYDQESWDQDDAEGAR